MHVAACCTETQLFHPLLLFLSADADYGRQIEEKLTVLSQKRQNQPAERPRPSPLNPPRTVPLRGNL